MRLQDNRKQQAHTAWHTVQHLARVWRATVRAGFIREMEFRVNFVSGLLRQTLWLGTFIFLIEIVFRNTQSLVGWNKAEVLVVLALSRLLEGVIDVVFSRNIARFPEKVRTGAFDFYLTKPIPAQFAVAFERFNFLNLGNVIAGSILLSYALVSGSEIPAPATWALFLLLAGLGMVMYYCLLLSAASLVFFFERLESLVAISHLFSEPLTVPFDVFPRDIRILLTYLLPLAFVVFIPAQALTGRLQWWYVPSGIAMSAALLTITNLIWRAGLRHYTSASS